MGYKYDYSKLLGRMRENHITQEQLAKDIGISESTMNIKLKNKRQFAQDEMIKILDVLNVPIDDIGAYFFVITLLKTQVNMLFKLFGRSAIRGFMSTAA